MQIFMIPILETPRLYLFPIKINRPIIIPTNRYVVRLINIANKVKKVYTI